MRPRNKQRVVPMRIMLLREEKGLNQTEFTKELNKIISPNSIGASTVSMWESGRRPVSNKYTEIMMKYFGVSRAYLLGLTEDKSEELNQDEIEELLNSLTSKSGDVSYNFYTATEKLQITNTDLFRFHLCPVYVEYSDLYAMNGWAIYDDIDKELVFPDRRVNVNDHFWKTNNVKMYVLRPEYDTIYGDIVNKTLDLKRTLKCKRVFVKMNSPYMQVRNLYNGWYHHNENKTALINNNGLVLPYEGIGISYNCFSEGDENVRAFI